ncbi:MAG: ParA family protein, partial [Eisenbergiella sp.]
MKGGTGKTTTALNLAFEFSAEGKAVLCIDLDGQCNLTSYFEPRIDRQRPAITEIIMKKQDLASGITHSQYHELDFIAGSEKIGSLAQADSSILSNCLNDIGDLYDFCIIDCHPHFSVISGGSCIRFHLGADPVRWVFTG